MQGVILAVVVSPDTARDTLAAAACLAAVTGKARIEVLAIRTPPAATILPTEEILTKQQEQRIKVREQERAASLKAVYETWSSTGAGKGIDVAWFDVEGLAEAVIQEWGSRADFIVMRRPDEHDKLSARQAIHTALFATDRPVLVAPGNPVAGMGRGIAIAWRDDRRTIRAVLSSLRCLGQAERVYVLAGVREGAPRARIPDILSEHAIDAELHELPIGPGVFGAALLAKAHALGADMLVVGAYVHSPLRSMILGGVTRYMLDHADLPLLMRH
jgi:nucleotide-binding universal stress UspA family protein